MNKVYKEYKDYEEAQKQKKSWIEKYNRDFRLFIVRKNNIDSYELEIPEEELQNKKMIR